MFGCSDGDAGGDATDGALGSATCNPDYDNIGASVCTDCRGCFASCACNTSNPADCLVACGIDDPPSAGGTTGSGGTSAGGTSAGGASAGGTSAGGTSVGGTNAGGTSAGGTNMGGTTSGGTSSGGTSSGGTSSGGTAGTGTVDGCPPPGPYGQNPGDVTPNSTLYDCSGNPVGLHELCVHRAGYVYTWAGW